MRKYRYFQNSIKHKAAPLFNRMVYFFANVFYCPGKEAALVIIVVACLVSNDKITHLYHIHLWIFDCVLSKNYLFKLLFGAK